MCDPRPTAVPGQARSRDHATDTLLAILKTHLENAEGSNPSATRLRLLRGSTVPGLHRIAQITGANLTKGGYRLARHIAFKLPGLATFWFAVPERRWHDSTGD